jgi:hypothetical protein
MSLAAERARVIRRLRLLPLIKDIALLHNDAIVAFSVP